MPLVINRGIQGSRIEPFIPSKKKFAPTNPFSGRGRNKLIEINGGNRQAMPWYDLGGPDLVAAVITTPSTISTPENEAKTITLTANKAVDWYLVGDADIDAFSLVGNQLTLPPKNYEDQASFVVIVRAVTAALVNTDKTITFELTDIEEVDDYVPALRFNDPRNSMYIGQVV